MRALILRPPAPNERFGLGPFFRIEPLGAEYVAAALEKAGHQAAVYDMRFSPRLERLIERHRPDLVGIACAHTLDTPGVLALARRAKAADPSITLLVGGHAAAVYPSPLFDPAVDAICTEDGERVVPELMNSLRTGRPLHEVAGITARDPAEPGHAAFIQGPVSSDRVGLDEVPLPARHLLYSGHRNYLCVQRRPVHLVETARGCPYRCRFCSVWQHVDRTFRYRSDESVSLDMASVGSNVFMADDLFWYPEERSLGLSRELLRRGIRKSWILAQTRTDLVARHPELLEAWRPLAGAFDIFFGFEAPTDQGLAALDKDAELGAMKEALAICRRLDFGITGNFIIDPAWDRSDFERLWEFVSEHRLDHVGFTILTPLPGTAYFEETKHRILESDWSRYDMHHILWEPRLGRETFFELFAETWRRTALHVKDTRGLLGYLRQVRPSQIPFLLKVLNQSRRLFNPRAYLAEAFPEGACPVHAAGTTESGSRTAGQGAA